MRTKRRNGTAISHQHGCRHWPKEDLTKMQYHLGIRATQKSYSHHGEKNSFSVGPTNLWQLATAWPERSRDLVNCTFQYQLTENRWNSIPVHWNRSPHDSLLCTNQSGNYTDGELLPDMKFVSQIKAHIKAYNSAGDYVCVHVRACVCACVRAVCMCEWVCFLVAKCPSYMLVYLRDGSAQTILHAATLR